MNKIFEQAKDLHVVGVYVYSKDGKAYADAECTVECKTNELKEAFIKGEVILVHESGYLKAIAFAENVIMFNGGEAITLTTAEETEE